MARQRAIEYTMPPEKLRVVGQPVAEQHCQPPGKKANLRRQLGWPQDKAVILLVGSGDGMGPIPKVARAVDESGLDVGLAIVAGRNAKLRAELEARAWENPVFIYGFTQEMPCFMRAADVLVTKAGPGTIAEALIAGLPIVLYARLPGQEDGNVSFVESEGVGVWAPNSQQVVRRLTRWVCRPREREQVAGNCRRAARPEAARTIARILGERVGLP
jgi:1,2-diacylglycerol 3-beta-galactosyltransferase